MKLRKLLLSGMALSALSLFAQTHTQGIEYYKADQFNNAKELLTRNLNNAGTDKALSYYYLGQISMRNGNTSEAEKYFTDGINANPENPYNYIGLGYIDLKKDDVKAAEKYFKEAESKAKKDQSVMVEIARAYYNTNPVKYKDQYEKRIQNALKKDVNNPDVYILQGDILRDEAYATGDTRAYGSAAGKYDMATSKDPTSAVAYVKYADMYMNANNPGYAIVKLEELINNNASSALGQRELANAYYENNQFDKAATQYGKYIKNPNHFKEDEDRYAFILFYDGKYQDAYNYVTGLLKENPGNFSALRYQFMNAAQLESMQNQLLPMAENLLAAHKANPENKLAPIDYNLVSDELAKGGKVEDAIALLEEGIKDQPNNANFNKWLAGVYINAEDYGKAADAYSGFLSKTPNPSYSDLAQQALYAYFGGLQNAEDVIDKTTGEVIRPQDLTAANRYYQMTQEFAEKAAAANPSQYKPHKILGDVAVATAEGNLKASAAVPEYTTAIELLEANPDPRYNNDAKTMYAYLAAYYLENGDNNNARVNIDKAIAIDPNNVNYQKISEAIK